MATTALGIAPDSTGAGVDPLTHRRVIASHWDNVGVVTGLRCSGRSDLSYDLAAGVCVTQRSGSDGMCEAYWPGGTVQTKAGDASNPRYDLVYVKSGDPTQGDADNHVTAGVVQGTPSSSPTVPSAPAGATAVDAIFVPAGMTATTAGTSTGEVNYAIPYGASLGLLAQTVDNNQGESADLGGEPRREHPITFYVPTRRLVELEFYATMTRLNRDSDAESSMWFGFYLDGQLLETAGGEVSVEGTYQTFRTSAYVTVGRGTHTVMTGTKLQSGSVKFLAGKIGNLYYKPRTFSVWDRGLAN